MMTSQKDAFFPKGKSRFSLHKLYGCNAELYKSARLFGSGSGLKGHSSRKLFCLVFSQKISTDLKTNFTKLEHSRDITVWISR